MPTIYTKKREYKIEIIDNKRVFIKLYNDRDLNIEKLIKEEYEKSKKIHKLINYPKALKYEDNRIFYEYINIKCSLMDRLNKGIYDYELIRKAAKFLRKLHDNGIIHEDFNPDNVVITNEKRLFFIDAIYTPFFKQINQVVKLTIDIYNRKINYSNINVYFDISRFLVYLKWIRPLNKPWLFLQRKKINKAVIIFLCTYFEGNSKKFNPYENALMENQVYMNTLQYNIEKKNIFSLSRIFWLLLIKILILMNRRKFEL